MFIYVYNMQNAVSHALEDQSWNDHVFTYKSCEGIQSLKQIKEWLVSPAKAIKAHIIIRTEKSEALPKSPDVSDSKTWVLSFQNGFEVDQRVQ